MNSPLMCTLTGGTMLVSVAEITLTLLIITSAEKLLMLVNSSKIAMIGFFIYPALVLKFNGCVFQFSLPGWQNEYLSET